VAWLGILTTVEMMGMVMFVQWQQRNNNLHVK
jgi:hypothetical protein